MVRKSCFGMPAFRYCPVAAADWSDPTAPAARPSHASQAQSRVKKIAKSGRIEIPAEQRSIKFEFAELPRSGDGVVRLEGLGNVRPRPAGGEKSVFGGVTGMIRRQENIAVVGVNGAGKSTFLH